MKTLITILFMVALIGCQAEPNEFYLDSTCPDEVKASVYEAVDLLNELCGQEVIVLLGERDDINPQDENFDFSVDSFSCMDNSPRSGLVGISTDSAYARVYLNELDNYSVLNWGVRHELGHYLGADDIQGENVMNGGFQNVIEYTSIDKEEICSNFN